MLDCPARVVLRDEANTIIAEKRRYYDGPDFVGLELGSLDRGLMTREEQLVMTEAEFQAHYSGMDAAALGYHTAQDRDGAPAVFTNKERSAYGANGVKTADRDAIGNERRYEFDPDGLFRIKLVDSLGETRFEYDRACGQQTRILYADGAETRFVYDAQGRAAVAIMPGEDPAQPVRTFSYNDLSIPHSRTAHFRTSVGADGEASAVSYFDGRGKEFQQRIEAGDGRVIVSALSIRNPWGDIKQEFEPGEAASLSFEIPSTAGLPSRKLFYDARGRIVRTEDFEGGVSQAEYHPFDIIVHDANDTEGSQANIDRGQFNTPRQEEFDVFRNRTRVVEQLAGGETAEALYRIGPRGDVLEIQDDAGVVGSYEYDKLGQRLITGKQAAGCSGTMGAVRSSGHGMRTGTTCRQSWMPSAG
jgi:YD repeat-containing protein